MDRQQRYQNPCGEFQRHEVVSFSKFVLHVHNQGQIDVGDGLDEDEYHIIEDWNAVEARNPLGQFCQFHVAPQQNFHVLFLAVAVHRHQGTIGVFKYQTDDVGYDGVLRNSERNN